MDGEFRRQRAVAPNQVVQVQPRQVFHGVVERAVVGVAIVIDLDGVRVGERGRRLDLALEAQQVLRIAGLPRPDQLEGARPAQQDVLGQVDLAHAAGAEPLFQPVLPHLPRCLHLPPQNLDAVRAVNRQGDRHAHPHDQDGQVNQKRRQESGTDLDFEEADRRCKSDGDDGHHRHDQTAPPSRVRDQRAVGHDGDQEIQGDRREDEGDEETALLKGAEQQVLQPQLIDVPPNHVDQRQAEEEKFQRPEPPQGQRQPTPD